MNRFVAFLRGMNLGRRRLKNDELCARFDDLGFSNVSAFLASGNVIFETTEADAAGLAARIAAGLAKALEYDVPTFLRTASEVVAIAGERPFTDQQLRSGGTPQVQLLAREPDRAARDRVLGLATADDLLVFGRRELYWLPRAGILDSQLDLKLIEKTVGPTTMRTKRTLERLAQKVS